MLTKFKLQWGLLALLATPAFAAPSTRNAVPGTLNYLEGQVSLNGAPVNSSSDGYLHVDPNQVVETRQGRAEMLLTPGIFLRLGDNSSIRMVSPNLIDTRVELLRGEAVVEAAQVFPENHIRILMDGTSTELAKHGLYAFNASSPDVKVFDGEAVVDRDGQDVKVKKGHEVALNGPFKAEKFNRDQTDSLYSWSRLRSEYESQASISSVNTVIVGGPGWYGAGWYWNPWWNMYSFIPGAGIAYSPFGWGFYSPGFYRGTVIAGGRIGGFSRGFARPAPMARGFSAPMARGGGRFRR